MILKCIELFEAAHFLPDYAGKCQRLHGHTYKVEIEIEGPVKPDGMVMDFSVLKGVLRSVDLDHQLLNDIEGMDKNPTAENMAVWIAKKLLATPGIDMSCLSAVTVWETPTNGARAEHGIDF